MITVFRKGSARQTWMTFRESGDNSSGPNGCVRRGFRDQTVPGRPRGPPEAGTWQVPLFNHFLFYANKNNFL